MIFSHKFTFFFGLLITLPINILDTSFLHSPSIPHFPLDVLYFLSKSVSKPLFLVVRVGRPPSLCRSFITSILHFSLDNVLSKTRKGSTGVLLLREVNKDTLVDTPIFKVI